MSDQLWCAWCGSESADHDATACAAAGWRVELRGIRSCAPLWRRHPMLVGCAIGATIGVVLAMLDVTVIDVFT